MPKKIVFLVLSCLLELSVFGQKKVNVLFVGNSFTYYNNLPKLVSLIALCDSVEMTYKVLAFPNYALEDHWNEGHVITQIKTGTYDFVVVQQGPSSQQEGRTMLVRDGKRLAKLCAESKTKLAFYMVWPSKERQSDFLSVMETYQQAADSTKGILCPAGRAWLKAWEIDPSITLYGEDNFHPNYQGSLLASFMIYGSIMNRTNLYFADFNVLKNPELSKTAFKEIVQAAQQTLTESKKQKRVKRT